MDLQSLHRLKRKEVIASNRKPLTKCSFRDQGKGGWGGGGQLQLLPSPCSTAILGPCRRTHSPAWPCTSSTWEHILHKPVTAPGSLGNVVGTCPLPWSENWFAGRWSYLFFGITYVITQIPPARQKLPSVPFSETGAVKWGQLKLLYPESRSQALNPLCHLGGVRGSLVPKCMSCGRILTGIP